MKLLQNLYFIHSPSGGEKRMSKFIQRYLKEMGILDFQVLGNQIYRIKKNTPMVVAHMDQVGKTPIKRIFYSHKEKIISGDANIGADDKNGIWVILNLLAKFKDLSFIFSDQEEAGGNVDAVFDEIDDNIIKTIKYCLVFDRRNGSDILASWNDYCGEDLEKDIVEIGKKYGYVAAMGLWSDCDIISSWVPCVNLSCGYYLPHTEKEYTSISELKKSLAFGEELLSSLTKTYNRVDKPFYKYGNYLDNYNTYGRMRQIDSYYGRDHYNSDRIYYCSYCGEHFGNEDQFVIGECPTCESKTIEMIGYYTDSQYNHLSNIKEYYYCAHCDVYTDIDDKILGLEDSPEICRQCGNVKYKFRDQEEEEDKDPCIECPNYETRLCDDSHCKTCTFYSSKTSYDGSIELYNNVFKDTPTHHKPNEKKKNKKKNRGRVKRYRKGVRYPYNQDPILF